MRLLRVGGPGRERLCGFDERGDVRDLSSMGRDLDASFLATGGLEAARDLLAESGLPKVSLDEERIGPPIARPGKIVCVGVNYRAHAEETQSREPKEPILFLKASNAVIGPSDDILIPHHSTKTDWEIELAVVIGAKARYLESPEQSASVIAGYSISNDVSEREFQREHGGQWTKGKSCETFNPFGPFLVTKDEVQDPQGIRLRLAVNGVERQNASTGDMIFPVDHLVWYISQFMVLDPGDVVNTGTPSGVALGDPEQPYLKPGDLVELTADGLGGHRCHVAQAR
jgi:2-keto-4-pentenoate hydratase/2-oxohepta-3-ene-1,7-dioic acid hydratase in catechol pathway